MAVRVARSWTLKPLNLVPFLRLTHDPKSGCVNLLPFWGQKTFIEVWMYIMFCSWGQKDHRWQASFGSLLPTLLPAVERFSETSYPFLFWLMAIEERHSTARERDRLRAGLCGLGLYIYCRCSAAVIG